MIQPDVVPPLQPGTAATDLPTAAPGAEPAPPPTIAAPAPATRQDDELSGPDFAAGLALMPTRRGMARRELRAFTRAMGRTLIHRFPLVVVLSAMGLGVALLLNTAVRSIFYGDSSNVPSGAAVAGPNNWVVGQLATLLITSLVVGVFAYRWQVGGERFWRDVRELPSQVGALLRADGRGMAGIHVLWGFAGSMLVVSVVGTAIGALFAAGAVLSFGTVIRPVVVSVLMAAFRGFGGVVAPRHQWPPSAACMVAMMGGVLAAVVAIAAQPLAARLVLALVAAGLAVLLGRRRPVPQPR